MAVNVRIKQEKKLFKKILNVFDVIDLWESSCININGDKSVALIGMHDNFFIIDSDFLNLTKENNFRRLEKIKKSNSFILFDRLNLNRGISFTFDNNDILLSLSYPATLSEIKSFYLLIKKICKKVGTDMFNRDDSEGDKIVNVNDIEKFNNIDYSYSYQLLKQLYDKADLETYTIFGIMNPISISKKELGILGFDKLQEDNTVINGIMIKYEQYLNDLQKVDRYYAIPSCYKKNDNFVFCVFPCPPECETIVPLEPEYDFAFYKQFNPGFATVNKINKYYAVIGYNNKMYKIEYKHLLEKFNNENKYYYDSKHIVINYNNDYIEDLIENYDVEEI